MDICFVKTIDFELTKIKRIPLVFKELYVGNHNKILPKTYQSVIPIGYTIVLKYISFEAQGKV